jgi:uncharacterized membrane protein
MKTVKCISLLTCLVIVLTLLCLPVAGLADDNATSDNVTSDNVTSDNITPTVTPEEVTTEPEPTPVPADNITLTTDYTRLDAVATGSFSFNVNLDYKGQIDRDFDLKATVPSGWDVYMQPQYETGKKISTINIQSSYSGMSKQITLVATPPSYPIPDPGDYKILMQATSGNVTGSIELVARITAKYALYAVPVNQLYNTSVQAGKDNIYSIELSNTGSASMDNIVFSSSHPDGWEVIYTPDKLDTLNASDKKTIDVDIKPPPKTVAGDYMISLTISGKQASADKIDVRVTVRTPTIWGWVGVIIILVVVVGLFFLIMRFGRR